MMCIKQLTGIAMLSASIVSYAGVVAPTAHSRANCGGSMNQSLGTWGIPTGGE